MRFLQRSLVLTGQIDQRVTHNGAPYSFTRSYITWYARVRYYFDNWNFSVTYISPLGAPDGAMNGIWVKTKSDWYLTVGWSNSDWNVKADILNMTRWNWRSNRQIMHSRYYDTYQQIYDGTSHALIKVSVTYTFGFGKKVSRDNEPSVSGTSSSGILK